MAKRKRLQPPSPDRLESSGRMEVPRTLAPIANVAGDAAATAAATELSETLRTARATGRMVVDLPLDSVDTRYLVRDRIGIDPDEMAALVASIEARGQQAPIEVVDRGEGTQPRYGLISGWRRVQALRRISEKGADDVTVLAFLRRPAEASQAYLAMVEENEIRVGLSYYERARIARKAVEQGAFPTTKAALMSLFHAASRAKRSKIRSFITVVEALEGSVTFPEEMGERAGLQLARALEADPGLKGRLRRALDNALAPDGAAEQRVIAEILSETGRTVPVSGKTGTVPAKTPTVPEEAPDRVPLRNGLYFTQCDNGEILLGGPGLTRDLRSALIAWLSDRK